jgi:hypothetical protein
MFVVRAELNTRYAMLPVWPEVALPKRLLCGRFRPFSGIRYRIA